MRALNRLLALAVGLALVGAGAFMALETILAATGAHFVVIPGRRWLQVLRHTPWSATTVTVVMALIAAGGLVLLMAELRRWRRWRTPLPLSARNERWWVTRRSVDAHLARQLGASTDALRPRTKLTPRDHHWRIKVVAGLSGTEPISADVVSEQIQETTRRALARLGAPESSRIKVRLRNERQPKHKTVVQ